MAGAFGLSHALTQGRAGAQEAPRTPRQSPRFIHTVMKLAFVSHFHLLYSPVSSWGYTGDLELGMQPHGLSWALEYDLCPL